MTALPFAATAPVSVSKIGLKARDAATVADYYRTIVGLSELSRKNGLIVLGADDVPLLEIEEVKSAPPDDPRSAGLFHTAFLLPQRGDLARWTRHAIDNRIRVDGASDHLVSEAIYLTDPEGNGIEIYADRPPDQWRWSGDSLEMATLPLDIAGLVSEAGGKTWSGVPTGSIVGHVHLRVGDPAIGEEWWHNEMGFDTMARYGSQAVFLSTGGYHHHIGANSWQSAGAGRRDPDRSGLSWVELKSRRAEEEKMLEDPWGNVIRVVPSATPDAPR